MKRMGQSWQQQALYQYDMIPELHFACHFIARMMLTGQVLPGQAGQRRKDDQIAGGAPRELLNQIQDPGGGGRRCSTATGCLSSSPERAFSSGQPQNGPERWRFLWKDEVKEEGGVTYRLDADRKPVEAGVGYRLWTPHPRHSDEPDSPVRSVLEICEELLILTASVRGTAVSRMTNGIFYIPTEMSFNAPEPLGAEDAENNIFLADYVEHVQNQIENPGAAESKVPFLLEGAYDYGDRLRWIQTHDPQNDYLERELRKEAVQRMAMGLDMPPEALMGMTDANHWTAKQVMHDMWRSHGIPKAEQFADELSEAYLRAALEEENYPGWQDIVVGMDDSQVVISPDRTEDADKALDRIAISFAAYREMKGIPEDLLPPTRSGSFGLAQATPAGGDRGRRPHHPAARPPAQSNGNGDAADGPPDPGARLVSRQESRTASILGAAEMALMRCRKLAGVRIRHKCKDCAEGHPESVVASVLGPTEVTDPLKLVQGGAEDFQALLPTRGWSQRRLPLSVRRSRCTPPVLSSIPSSRSYRQDS